MTFCVLSVPRLLRGCVNHPWIRALWIACLFPASGEAVAADLSPALPQPPKAVAYAEELVARAEQAGLYQRRQWHVLLHYRKGWFGRYESEVDGTDFFNAPNGKQDPRAELAATIRAFFAGPPDDPNAQHPQCRFIARYRWLKAQLAFDPARLPEQDCPRFDRWRGALGADTVTVVFPSAYLNSPPSMFGHTLLRTDRRDRTDLLDYAINYEAHAPKGSGFVFAVKGVFGAYPGRFSLLPYYAKVKNYGEIENRDIWEYRLALEPDEIERLLAHAWELGPTYFDYFFFKENCSYHLLSLFEAARPELDLTGRFHLWTLPTDTLRLLRAEPGLVADVGYRPARSTQIRARQSRLGREERRLARGLYRGRVAPDGAELEVLPPQQRAAVLELANAYLQYAQTDRKGEPDRQLRTRALATLSTRSRIDGVRVPDQVPVPATAPDEGHRTTRLSLGGGRLEGQGYSQFEWRSAYHDLMDPDPGYAPGSQLGFMDLAVRHVPDEHKIYPERLTVIDILSLSPRDGFFRERSWKVSFGWRRVPATACLRCGMFNFNAGPGLAYGANLLGGVTAYTFADLDANYGANLEPHHALGGGLHVGLLARLTRFWKVHLYARRLVYPEGADLRTREAVAETRLSLGNNLALRAAVKAFGVDRFDGVEQRLMINGYF